MDFTKASDNSKKEIRARRDRGLNVLSYGIPFLDHALKGILQNDLVLIGAPSGVGKTALCSTIALENISNGKRVHYFALEAERFEIESRMKFQIIAGLFYDSPGRIPGLKHINFDDWFMGKYLDVLNEYEIVADDFFTKAFSNLLTFYKVEDFAIPQFIERTIEASLTTDLVIVDHVHYFDFDDENENRAVKKIATTARTLALENSKPIILVAHLRKRDKNNPDLVSGLDEFHGSSDLYKIATRVITFAGGSQTESGGFETFFRIPKNRINGGVTRFLGRVIFNPKKGGYEKEYKIGNAETRRDSGFEEIDAQVYPDWAKRRVFSNSGDTAQREPSIPGIPIGQRLTEDGQKKYWWE